MSFRLDALALIILIVGAASGLVAPRSAWAARAATVDTDGIEVREGPGPKYKVLDRLPKGTPVAAANQPIEGYFRIRTGAGLIGFVPADALVLQPVPSDDVPATPPAPPPDSGMAPSEIPRPTLAQETGFRNKTTRKYFRLRALGGYNFFNVSDINNLLSSPGLLQFGYSFGGEAQFLFTPDLALVIRVEKVFKSVFAQDQLSRKSFTMNLSSYPVEAGLDLALTNDTHWSIHLAVLAGLGLTTDLQAIDISDTAPNVTEMSSTTFTGMGKLDVAYNFNKTWGVFFEGGYRYLQTSQIIPGAVENGSSIFEDPHSGAFVPVTLNLSGPFVGGGASFTF